MSRKRPIFDILLPEEPAPETFPAGKVSDENQSLQGASETVSRRRGPMAAAISETAGSLQDRAATLDAIRAENDALAHEHVRLKRMGLVADLVEIDRVETWKLTRDRARTDDDVELAELVASIREVGLSNPIRVEPRPDGRFELIQGFRRLSAYRQLLQETGDAEAWGRIPAAIVHPGETIETLYRRMVDENLVRKDISFAEMAQLALAYAADPETGETDPERAVKVLFRSAGYQKRSYIRGFLPLVGALGDDLRFAHHIPRALGLTLAQRLEEEPTLARRIREELRGWDNRSVQDELNLLRRMTGAGDEDQAPAREPPPAPSAPPPPPVRAGGGQVRFDLDRPRGTARVLAGQGRIEIRLDRDFSTLERWRIEAAVRALLDQLD